MADQRNATEILDGILAQAMAAEPADKEEIVRLGSAIEGLLESGQVPAEVEPLLTLSLEALQGLYQQTLADPAAALDAVAAALGCARECRAAPTGRRSERTVPEAVELLQQALGTPPACQPQAGPPPPPHAGSCISETPLAPDPSAGEAPPAPSKPPAAPAPPGPGRAPAPTSAAPTEAPSVLPADTDMDLLKEFIVECLDHVTAAEASLLDLEADPDNGELINTIFRAFHTIKGTSGFLGLDRIQNLAHLAESLLNRGRDNQIKIRGGYADLALKSCDTLRTMLEGLKEARPGQSLAIPPRLEDLLAELGNPESHGISDESQPEGLRLGDILVGQGAAPREAVEQAARIQGDQKLGVALVEAGAATAGDVAKAMRTQKKLDGADPDSTIRMGTARLDSLIDMVGELVIAQSMVAHDRTVAGAADLGRKVVHADKIVRELQDLTMSLRMVPLRATFQKMARLVRDLGRKSGKNVQFVCDGEGTEIDRSMVEVLSDPLVHMIRNSVDHGIEPEEGRVKAGKNPVGTVTLRAYHAAGKGVIELRDDGRGLNQAKILAKAVEKGLVPGGREMTEAEIFALIFRPGFSTAPWRPVRWIRRGGSRMCRVLEGFPQFSYGRADDAAAPRLLIARISRIILTVISRPSRGIIALSWDWGLWPFRVPPPGERTDIQGRAWARNQAVTGRSSTWTGPRAT